MQPLGTAVTKARLRKAILWKALEYPFHGPEDVIDFFAEAYKMDISDGKERQNLDLAIQATTHLTPTSARTAMGDLCDDELKVRGKTCADLPLPPGGPGVEMDEGAFKTFGQTTPLTGVTFELSFAVLEVLIKTHSMTVTTTNPFDGYIPLQLLIWFLLQVALDKKLVRTGVCVYALRLLMSTGHYRLPSRRWGSPERRLLPPCSRGILQG
jgi:hypothetical protein